MILVATDDARLQHLIGKNISTSKSFGDNFLRILVEENTTNDSLKEGCCNDFAYFRHGTTSEYILSVLKAYPKDFSHSSYIVKTKESTLEFKMNDNEIFCRGNTFTLPY